MRLTELHDDLVALRADLAAELDAISRLESHAFALTDDEAREEVRRIADEKKGHAAALARQVARLDPKFAERMRAV